MDRVDGRSYFEIKVLAAFSGAVLVVVLLAATAWKVPREAIDVEHQVSHTHYVLNNLAHARSDTLLVVLSTQGHRNSVDKGLLPDRDAATPSMEAWLRRVDRGEVSL